MQPVVSKIENTIQKEIPSIFHMMGFLFDLSLLNACQNIFDQAFFYIFSNIERLKQAY